MLGLAMMGHMNPELAALSRSIDLQLLGRRIRAARITAGMTQAQLAADDVTTAYISRIEDGQRRPEAGLLERMAARLHASLEELLLGISADQRAELRMKLDYAELALSSGDARAALKGAAEVLIGGADANVVDLHRAARVVQASALEVVGDFQGAIVVLKDLTATPTADSIWLKSLIALSRCYRETGDLNSAIAVGEREEATIKGLGIAGLTEAIQLTITVAGAYMLRGDNGYALRLCLRSIETAEKHDSPIARASAYWNASLIESRNGAAKSALVMARKAIALFELGDDSRNLGRLRTEVASMQLKLEPPDAHGAIETLEQAGRELAWSSASATDIATCLLLGGRAHLLLGEHVPALESLTKSSELAPSDAPILQASIQALQGQVAAFESRIDDARGHYQAAVQALSGVGADRDAAQLWFELAGLLTESGDTEAALDAYRRAAVSTGLSRPSAASHLAS
jgi:transcriptional regulator with XRE-family HTH domain/HAMP domain-containing protein